MGFDFLTRKILERRSYIYSALDREFIYRESSRMNQTYPSANFFLPSDGIFQNPERIYTTVSHVLAPSTDGTELIERNFDIELPSDFKAFYNIYNEGLILGRNPVLIMSPEKIVFVSDDLRDAHEIPTDLPRHVIRFGWLGTDSYFLLLFNARKKEWEVRLSSYSHATDYELQDGTVWGTPCDPSFIEWLRRMIETDGAPLHPSHIGDFDFCNKRIELG